MKKSRMEISPIKKEFNKGAWTEEEDRKLGEVISVNGPRRWKTIATKAGLNRCGKSCRLRWLNYLRPNIKRGNISHQEQDLIIRLHKLLGNRWSLIAGRLPGRTDNEVKNYWNSHLSKRMNNKQKLSFGMKPGQLEANDNSINTAQEEKEQQLKTTQITTVSLKEQATTSSSSFNTEDDDFFDFSNENPLNLEWVTRFLKKKLD